MDEQQKQKRWEEILEQKPQPKDGPTQRKLRKEDTPCLLNCNAKSLRLPVSPVKSWEVFGTKERTPLLETELPRKMAGFASAEPPPSRLCFGAKGDTFRLGGQLLALCLGETEGPFNFDDS